MRKSLLLIPAMAVTAILGVGLTEIPNSKASTVLPSTSLTPSVSALQSQSPVEAPIDSPNPTDTPTISSAPSVTPVASQEATPIASAEPTITQYYQECNVWIEKWSDGTITHSTDKPTSGVDISAYEVDNCPAK